MLCSFLLYSEVLSNTRTHILFHGFMVNFEYQGVSPTI